MKNGVMFQGFEWYLPEDGQFYVEMKNRVGDLKEIGFTAIWIPPCFKGTGINDVGYGIYDLYDMGEFDQKGSVRTKYGLKSELIEMIAEFQSHQMQVYLDVVMNHKAGADRTEPFLAVKVDRDDRSKEIEEPREIEGWTVFDFPGRGDKYSSFKWNYTHFNGVDFNQKDNEKGIFRIIGENKGWNLGVSTEFGSYDYLMYADIDHAHPDVVKEFLNWSEWLIRETNADGFRLDALKHIDTVFINAFTKKVKDTFGDDFYMVGEYWDRALDRQKSYIESTLFQLDMFDVGLHFNLHEASTRGDAYDLRTIFDNTMVTEFPDIAVTFSDNHDSQPGQALQSWVEPWFKEHAYALILLREKGYPCVFYGDYYGVGGDKPYDGMKDKLNLLMKLRRESANGEQIDYFNDPNKIGWVRMGDLENPDKIAVLLSNKNDAIISMNVGLDQIGKMYKDVMGYDQEDVIIKEDGFGDFRVKAGKLSVWKVK